MSPVYLFISGFTSHSSSTLSPRQRRFFIHERNNKNAQNSNFSPFTAHKHTEFFHLKICATSCKPYEYSRMNYSSEQNVLPNLMLLITDPKKLYFLVTSAE